MFKTKIPLVGDQVWYCQATGQSRQGLVIGMVYKARVTPCDPSITMFYQTSLVDPSTYQLDLLSVGTEIDVAFQDTSFKTVQPVTVLHVKVLSFAPYYRVHLGKKVLTDVPAYRLAQKLD